MCSNLSRKIRRRCISPKTITWSTHSRRIDPISRSAKPFCQGEAGAVGLFRMPMARNRYAAIDPVAIADQVVRCLVLRKCLRYLTCNPLHRRICCDVDPDEVSAAESDDDEGIEQIEADGRDNEQVHGGNVRRVVMQEGLPSLARLGGPRRLTMYLATLDCATSNPSLSSSP